MLVNEIGPDVPERPYLIGRDEYEHWNDRGRREAPATLTTP